MFTASTSEVYGKSDKVPFHEDADLVLGPTSKGRWSYAASKALDEFLALSYLERKETAGCRSLDFSIRWGRARRAATAWCCRISCAKRSQASRLLCTARGRQSRCFCDVRDCVQAVLRLIGNDQSVGEVVNIGSTDEESHRGPGASGEAKNQEQFTDHAHPLRPGVRTWIRGHAAARAGP